jgi:hypothetical protein
MQRTTEAYGGVQQCRFCEGMDQCGSNWRTLGSPHRSFNRVNGLPSAVVRTAGRNRTQVDLDRARRLAQSGLPLEYNEPSTVVYPRFGHHERCRVPRRRLSKPAARLWGSGSEHKSNEALTCCRLLHPPPAFP